MRIVPLSLLVWSLASLSSGCRTADTLQPVIPEANQTPTAKPPKRSGPLPVLFLVGDSTVHNVAPGLVGWGDVLSNRFNLGRITVQNWAKPGRSTRTFISQGWWGQVLSVARPGDFVIIQMGHNDGSPVVDANRNRGTLPGIGDERTNVFNALTHRSETVFTYGGYLRRYLAEARAQGIMPILCTAVPRLPQPGKEPDTTRYAVWAREVAAAEKVPLIDLNRCALERWGSGPTEEIFTAYFAKGDTTHFNRAGAELNAECVVEGIRTLPDCPLKDFLTANPR